MKKKLSTLEIVNKGWSMVNIPAVAIIFAIWFCLVAYIHLNGTLSTFIGGAAGWIYWAYMIKKWINWALDNDVVPDRLAKIGVFFPPFMEQKRYYLILKNRER